MARSGRWEAEGKYGPAETLFQQALEASRKALGPEQQNTLGVMNNLADLYVRQGRPEQAEATYRQVLEVRRRVLVPDHPRIARVLASLGELKLEQKDYADAEGLLRQALQIRDKATPNAWERFYAQSLLGATLAGQRKYAAAEPFLLSGYRGLRQRRDFMPAESWGLVERARREVARLYVQWGKPEQAFKGLNGAVQH